MSTTMVDEVARLKDAELEAEQHYFKALMSFDLSAVRKAKRSWTDAADALTEYVANHPDLYSESGQSDIPSVQNDSELEM